ncbi:SDR family oxidoreductase [Kribbella sindirgiensis]|uniref:NAD-dependent epimerase/dehydratase family protein n=1 Tax=Kribbella sindirgiensis TaxID=1124744 RepID=A0A4R0I2T3_9ACTN|nr:NAD(P)H-binding protein [Kribbella sindirgiensis]TCC21281.1 NAD-dependent epimerase/dehydratase family protein [Kribbella sindirgiensis]
MTSLLVTGGTGHLGRPTVIALRAAGHEVKVLSRRAGPDRVVADLTTGEGLAAALEGADVVVHLATSLRGKDAQQTRNLLPAAAGVKHLVVMSIAGIDRIPLGYYRAKLEVERLVEESGVPYTIQRATQFHALVDRVFAAQRYLPVVIAPKMMMQPIAAEDVAARLTELVGEPPVKGRAPDIGGPERLSVPELAHLWKRAKGSRRPILGARLGGKVFRAFANGEAMVDGPAYGRITFAEHLG